MLPCPAKMKYGSSAAIEHERCETKSPRDRTAIARSKDRGPLLVGRTVPISGDDSMRS